MLINVEWGEFKLDSLFEITNTLSFNADSLVKGSEYDYVTRTSQNQGVLQTTGFVNKSNINDSGNWSLGLMQMDFFYREKPWYAGQFVRKITPKIKINNSHITFLTTALNKLKPYLLTVLVRNVDKAFKESKIQLPIKNGEIDFDFMETFIEKLEKERIKKVDTYLSVSGLQNIDLTDEETTVLEKFETDEVQWREYKMKSLFERIKTKKLPFKADELSKQPTGDFTLPCLTSSFKNQGLNYYAPKEDATILKNVISIPSNSDVYRAYFQPNDFTVLSDAYAIKWILNHDEITPNQYLFVVQSINKVTDLSIYSYKNKLGGWNVVKDKFIKLPTHNNEPDYKTMELLISALKKKIIKGVVTYTAEKLN